MQIVIGGLSLRLTTHLRNRFAGASTIHVNPNGFDLAFTYGFQEYSGAPWRKSAKSFQMYANRVADSAFIVARDVCPTSSAPVHYVSRNPGFLKNLNHVSTVVIELRFFNQIPKKNNIAILSLMNITYIPHKITPYFFDIHLHLDISEC